MSINMEVIDIKKKVTHMPYMPTQYEWMNDSN